MTIRNNINILIVLLLSGCSLSPGMHMETKVSWVDDGKYVYIQSLDKKVRLVDISETLDSSYETNYFYRIGVGDQISVIVWGLPEIFPIVNSSGDQNLRRVDTNGNIFFPYAGLVKAAGKTQSELRNDITAKLSKYFTDPQLDLSIVKFNSQKIFVLGEVTRPTKLNIMDRPISLSDAIGESFGLNTNTAAAEEVFIIRQSQPKGDPLIFYANLKTPSGFIEAGNFFLINNDIVYVNSSSTTRWNKVISQFFPFSTFLNSIDNLTND
jgi:polysaccharide export outer membrane protein